MKRSEKIALALAVTAVAASAAYLTVTTAAKNKREAAMARLLAPSPTPKNATDSIPAPQPATPITTHQVDQFAFRDYLRENRDMLTDWALGDYIKAWKRDAFEFTVADWREGARLVEKYQNAIDATIGALEVNAPMSGFELDDHRMLSLLGYLTLIDAEISFRNGNNEKGLQRLIATPLPFSLACDLMNRALPNPVPHGYIEPLLQRLNEFVPNAVEANRIVWASQDYTERWAQGLPSARWLQHPIDYGQRVLMDIYMDGPGSTLYESPLGRAMVDRDIATYLDLQARIRDAVLMPYPEGRPIAEAIDHEVSAMDDESLYLVRRSNIRAAECIERVARETARLELPQLGILIERYYADHHTFPELLATIAGRLPNGLPSDPFTDKDYVYRTTPDTFILYSLGPNQTDDNANPTNDLDIVWRPQR